MKIYVGETYISIFKILLVIAALVPVILSGSMMASGSPGMVISGGCFMVGALYIFGYVCSFCYTGTFANGLVDALLYPRRYLAIPPVITSRQRGLIANGKYQLAEQELFIMRMQNPSAPDLTWLLTEIHLNHYCAPELAAGDCEFYFAVRHYRYNETNIQILMRYADIMRMLGDKDKLIRRLKQEAGSLCYSPPERKAIRERLLRENGF